MTKMDRLKEWLLRYGSISSWEAIEGFGLTRLAAYIKELKDKGWIIEKMTQRGTDRFGNDSRWARYYLKAIPASDAWKGFEHK